MSIRPPTVPSQGSPWSRWIGFIVIILIAVSLYFENQEAQIKRQSDRCTNPLIHWRDPNQDGELTYRDIRRVIFFASETPIRFLNHTGQLPRIYAFVELSPTQPCGGKAWLLSNALLWLFGGAGLLFFLGGILCVVINLQTRSHTQRNLRLYLLKANLARQMRATNARLRSARPHLLQLWAATQLAVGLSITQAPKNALLPSSKPANSSKPTKDAIKLSDPQTKKPSRQSPADDGERHEKNPSNKEAPAIKNQPLLQQEIAENAPSQSRSESNSSAPKEFPEEISAELKIANTLIKIRRKGCGLHPGTEHPLLWRDALGRKSLLHLKGGLTHDEQIRASGYWSRGGVGMELDWQGSPNATANLAARGMCSDLMKSEHSAIGVAILGHKVHIGLAREYRYPKESEQGVMGERFLALINAAREMPQQCGTKQFDATTPLQINQKLSEAARLHTVDVFNHPGIGHRGKDGSTPTERAKRQGYGSGVGENLTNVAESPEEAVASLMRSPGHCANIMNPDYKEMGLGFAVDPQRPPGIVWVQKLSSGR